MLIIEIFWGHKHIIYHFIIPHCFKKPFLRNLQSSFTEVLTIPDSFSDKIAYEKKYRKVSAKQPQTDSAISEGGIERKPLQGT